MGRVWPILLLWLSLTATVAADSVISTSASRPLSAFFRESWTSRDGLPHNLINDIEQTADGYLWFATWEGVVRYNGREFVVFDRERVPGMPDHGFRAIDVGRDNGVWLGSSRGGVVRLQQGQWSFLGTADGLAQDEVMDVLEAADGSLWIALESAGVNHRHADGRIEHYNRLNGLPSDVTYSLAEDPQGRIWVGTGAGLVVIEDGQAREAGSALGLAERAVFSLHVDGRDRMLVGGESGIFERDGDRFRRLAAEQPRDPVQRVYRDRLGQVWAGTVNLGVMRLGTLGDERLGVDMGLPNARVAALLEDAESSLWVGTNGGLFRLRDAVFTTLLTEHGLPDDYVRTVIEDRQGALWVGTSSGLTRIVDGRSELIGDPDQSILSLEESADGSIWIGSYARGLLHWRDGVLRSVLDADGGLTGNQVRALLETRDGALWIGTNRGLSRWRDGQLRNFKVAEGLPRDFVIALHEDRAGSVWVGTANGLARIDEDGQGATTVKLMGGAQDVFGFAETADGSLWMGTDRGLARLRDGQISRLSYAEGLPIETLFQVVPDRHGNLWLSSNRGVVRIALSDAEAVADGRQARLESEMFGEVDGMASAQCNGGSGPAAVQRSDGSIAFATAKGLALVQPERLGEFARLAPPVVIEEIRVDDREVALSDALELPAGTRRIEFHYAGLSYLLPQKIRYRYQLEGFDPGWVERGNARTAQFTNLRPGDYRFRVVAANPNGGWSPVESSVRLTLQPFFWQRTGFWLSAAAVLLLLLAGLYRWRVAQIRHAESHLRELVDSRTADLRLQTDRLLQADSEKSLLLDQLRQQSEAFERLALEDGLTRLANRRAFDEQLTREFSRAARQAHPLSVMLVDIDWFKRINDGYSHAAGDQALRAVADVLRRECRGMDAIARYGGEEFAVLCAHTALEPACALAERLRAAIEAIDTSGFAPGLRITTSIGVAEATGLSHHERLISRADAALYRAKDGGRNRVCY